MTNQEVARLADQFQPRLVDLRRQIHRHPELGFQEFRTAALVADTLEGCGLEVTRNVAKTGVVGLLRGGAEGPTVALRADMDALPIQELNETEYQSQQAGVMHACGHDVHTACLLGAAMILAELRQQIRGNVKFIFQPAEEGPGGALPMIAAGVLENPKVDYIFGAHVWHDLPAGSIAAQAGPIMAAPDNFTITIIGRGGHGAQPHLCIDALAVAVQFISGLQQIVSRRTNPFDPVVLTIGQMTAGVRGNVIAEQAVLNGTLRTLNKTTQANCQKWMQELLAATCSAFGARYTLEYTEQYDLTSSDAALTKQLIASAVSVLGSDHVITQLEPSMGGEDFSFFMREIPGVYYRLGIADSEKGLYPIHHNRFDVNENALATGAKVMAQVTLDLLK
ncbi:MAG: amidohydrolase [Negativicutes bacterium]|nr:amidohydrolase [Negativicutes bacterium]